MSQDGAAATMRWSEAVLDDARKRGDPLADDAVAALVTSGGTGAVRALMATLVTNDQIVPAGLPAVLAEYLRTTSPGDARDAALVAAGERVFATHGPEILVILCCLSLPSSYSARRGVQVLYRTAYLAKRPTRRLFETSQMIIDVLSPDGLAPAGRGLRTIQKVRLMHAAIRHLLLHDDVPWPADDLGHPINQEDLLGTLMTFSWEILDGLQRIGITLTEADAEAYTATWMHIGRLMGIEPALIPDSVSGTRELTAIIKARQVSPSPEGRALTAALLTMMSANLPSALSALPASLIREFLPADVADGLGVPRHRLEEELLRAADHWLRPFERLVEREAGRHVALRVFAIRLLQWMQSVELGDARARFEVPASLNSGWLLAPEASEESFWKKLGVWEAARNA